MHGILPRPVLGQRFESCPICLVESSNRGFHANLRERIREQTLHGEQYLGNGQGQAPIVLDYVDSHVPVATHVRMGDSSEESDGGRDHGIQLWKDDVQEELATLVRTARWPNDRRREMSELCVDGHEIDPVRDLFVLVLQQFDLPAVVAPVRRYLLGHLVQAGAAETRVHQGGEHLGRIMNSNSPPLICTKPLVDLLNKTKAQLTSNQLGTRAISWNSGHLFFVY